jgi:hypothetical protein
MGPLLYDINSAWPGRVESADTVGSKFLLTLDSLQTLEPSFADWESSDELDGSNGYSIASRRERIADWLADHPPPGEDRAGFQGAGYWVYAVSGQSADPGPSRRAVFHVQAGSRFGNESHFEVGSTLRPPDPSFITFAVYRAALLAMISIWPASWACARCSIWGEKPPTFAGESPFPYSRFQMPWMGYLSADRAAPLNAPAMVITERTPDGGLLMIAAETRFDPTNVEHLRRARLIAEIMIEHARDP